MPSSETAPGSVVPAPSSIESVRKHQLQQRKFGKKLFKTNAVGFTGAIEKKPLRDRVKLGRLCKR